MCVCTYVLVLRRCMDLNNDRASMVAKSLNLFLHEIDSLLSVDKKHSRINK